MTKSVQQTRERITKENEWNENTDSDSISQWERKLSFLALISISFSSGPLSSDRFDIIEHAQNTVAKK
jgi:hypothetical protein